MIATTSSFTDLGKLIGDRSLTAFALEDNTSSVGSTTLTHHELVLHVLHRKGSKICCSNIKIPPRVWYSRVSPDNWKAWASTVLGLTDVVSANIGYSQRVHYEARDSVNQLWETNSRAQ